MANFPVTATDTGLTVTTTLVRLVGRAQPTTTGLTVTESIKIRAAPAIADTGLTVTDSIAPRSTRKLTDTGSTIVGSIAKTSGRFIAETGLTVADALAKTSLLALSDTGATISDSAPVPGHPVDRGLYATFPLTPQHPSHVSTENPLSDHGNWIANPGTFTQPLQISGGTYFNTLFNNESQQAYAGVGVLTDCEAYVQFGSTPTSGHDLGVAIRQDPTKAAGANCYVGVFNGTSNTVEIRYLDATGVSHLLASAPVPASTFNAQIGLRAEGPIISLWFANLFNSFPWTKVLEVTDTTLASGYIGLRLNSASAVNFGGGALTDTLTPTTTRFPTDTGASVVGDVISFEANIPPDTGLTLTESITRRVTHPLADTALTITDTLSIFGLNDTGLTISDSLLGFPIRTPTDQGMTFSDSTKKTAKHFIADTGLTVTTTLVATKNGSNPSVNITDIGLALTVTLTDTEHYFRSPTFPSADVGLSISDGLRITTTPPVKHRKPKANFSYDDSGLLLVAFTDTSDPGSAPISSWSWHFGDGVGTSSATNPSYTYATAGTYNVTLKVTTIYGSSSITKPVEVSSGVLTTGFHIDAVIV